MQAHSIETLSLYIYLENRTGNCDEGVHGDSDTPELGMDNVGGVFLVLAAGLVLAIFIGILEFLWNVRKVSIDLKVSVIPRHTHTHYIY